MTPPCSFPSQEKCESASMCVPTWPPKVIISAAELAPVCRQWPHLTVHFRQRARKRRVRREVGHSGEQRLRQVVHFSNIHEVAFFTRLRDLGDTTAVLPLQRPRRNSRP